MSLRRRQLRILRGMERELADSEPGLDALFQGFARRTNGHDMRWVEMIDRQAALAVFPAAAGAGPAERMKDRSAEKWNDP